MPIVKQTMGDGPKDSIRIEMPGLPSRLTMGQEFDLNIRVRGVGSIKRVSKEPDHINILLGEGWQLVSGDTAIAAHIDRGFDQTFIVRVRPVECSRRGAVFVRVYSAHHDSAHVARISRGGPPSPDRLYALCTEARLFARIYDPDHPEPAVVSSDTPIVTIKSMTDLKPPPCIPTIKALVDSGGQIFYPPAIPPPDTLGGRPK